MSNIQRALIGAFQHHRANERWIATMLYFTRIYMISRRTFERVFYATSKGDENGADSQSQARDSSQPAWLPVQFPSLHKGFFYYQTFGTVYMIYVVIRNALLLNYLDLFVEIERPAHCFLPGYFFLHPWIARKAATLLALLHLVWRLKQHLAQRPYFIHLFFFLTIRSENLHRFWSQFESGARVGTLGHESNVEVGDSSEDGINKSSGENPVERLLRRIICYKVKLEHGITYRLRPNRTPEARQKLQRVVAMAALYLGTFFCFLASSITIVIVTLNFNDRAFLARYPGCDSNLDRLNRTGQLEHWSFSGTWVEMYSLLFDTIENVVLWGDSGIALVFILATVYVMNLDNQLHQDHLHCQLKRVEAEVRRAHWMEEADSMPRLQRRNFQLTGRRILESDSRPLRQMVIYEEATVGRARGSAELDSLVIPHTIWKPKRQLELDNAVHDIQMQLVDFFKELKRTDMLISEIITATLCIWLSLFSVLSRYALDGYRYRRDTVALKLVLLVAIFSFCIITSVSQALLNLHRDCLRSYATLCSLMAYDKSEHKIKFLNLMKFFTVKKYCAYTLLHEYPFTKTTYLSAFGYSFSCLFFLDSLLRH